MSTTSNPLFLFPGIAKEYPIFERLIPLLPMPTKLVSYPEPDPRESLSQYAGRLAEQLPQGCLVAGISLGGMLAQEVAPLVQARACFSIASIRGPEQLPPKLRMWRSLGSDNCRRLLTMVGSLAALVPSNLRSPGIARTAALAGSSGAWQRWASSAVIGWNPKPNRSVPTLQIHGDADKTFPIRYVKPDVVIPGGRHGLTISNPDEVAGAMLAYLAKIEGTV